MLSIVDYAKRCEMEWYEVMRQSIDEPSATPVAILNHGELMVYELDENKIMGEYPAQNPSLWLMKNVRLIRYIWPG